MTLWLHWFCVSGLRKHRATLWAAACCRQRPGNLHSFANNRQAGIKASRAAHESTKSTLLHSLTDVQPWSSSRAWAGIWVTSESAHTAPPSEGGASGLHSRCPGRQAAESRCGQAAPALAQPGDSMRSIHGGASRASRNTEEAFRRSIPIASPISLFAF